MPQFSDALRAALTALSQRATLSVDLCHNVDAMRAAHAFMEAMPIMISIFDQDLRYIYVNQRYWRFANPANPNWQGAYIKDYLPAETVRRIMPYIASVLRGEHVSFHLDLNPAQGVKQTVLVNYEPIVTDDHSTIYLMTGQDATELKQAEQRLFAAQKMETLGQITGGIAHDFNNLIGVIVGNLSLLKLMIHDQDLLDRVERCRLAADRCSKLTSQLLSFARRQPMQPRVLTVRKQLDAMRDLLRATAPSNIEILFVDKAHGASIRVDQTQLESAIMNLVINARDAMPDGGRITIEVGLGQHDGATWTPDGTSRAPAGEYPDFIMIEVRDTGEGMSPDIASRAFEPFVTTKQEGAGSGMGLAMVYGFVRQSGGFVDLESKVGEGTSVRIFLPRALKGEGQVEPPAIETIAAITRRDILVVEDDPDMAAIMCEMLEMMGHAARHCGTATDALARLNASPEIDVVLTDIMLPGKMTGLALRQRIREQYPQIRVICVSGYQDQATRQSYAAQPDIEFLGKPFDFQDLAALLTASPPTSRLKDR